MGVACGVLHLDLCAARVQRCTGPLEGAHRQVHGCSFWRGLRTLQENELQLYGLLDLLQHERRATTKQNVLKETAIGYIGTRCGSSGLSLR
jgi:hypothetical protein